VWELRKANRYQLAVPVFVSWRHADGTFSRLAGITRDISMRGISFLAADTVEVGTFIELNVYLPSLHCQERGMKVHGEGTVVRVVTLGFFEKRIAAEVFFEREPEATLLASSSIQ
jgi:PilZ domain